MQRNFREQWHAQLFGLCCNPTMSKHVLFVSTFRADMRRHVFDHTNDGCAKLVEHINSFAGVEKCYVLWRRDDDRAVQVGLLSKCHLHVARARRKIDDQHVKRAPLHLAQHLLQGPHEHRAAPDHGLIFVGHQAERHHGHAKVAHRQDDFAIRRGGTSRDAEHARLRWAVDVCIQ